MWRAGWWLTCELPSQQQRAGWKGLVGTCFLCFGAACRGRGSESALPFGSCLLASSLALLSQARGFSKNWMGGESSFGWGKEDGNNSLVCGCEPGRVLGLCSPVTLETWHGLLCSCKADCINMLLGLLLPPWRPATILLCQTHRGF